ncbi:MAG: RnfABCDGE type electron transport complex subunit G [Planctomycetota bacterium]|nr:RnfABCDGE type electron transport complex subunit G [Planctomycetota bacterium]
MSTPASPGRIIGTLAAAGAFAGFALVFVHQATAPRIARNKAAALERAIREVLHDPASYDTLYFVDGRLTPETAPDAARVYRGRDADGKPVGFAIVAARPGFQDTVRLIFGYDPRTRRLLGMRVLESKETPGLGDKIEKDEAFVGQFEGTATPLKGVPAGKRAADEEVDMITGATISSRTVIRIINEALARWGPLLEAAP